MNDLVAKLEKEAASDFNEGGFSHALLRAAAKRIIELEQQLKAAREGCQKVIDEHHRWPVDRPLLTPWAYDVLLEITMNGGSNDR